MPTDNGVLPDRFRAAFRWKTQQTFPEIAALIGIDVDTLTGLVKRYHIRYCTEPDGRVPRRTMDIDGATTLWGAIEMAPTLRP